ncbi:hypothetical protein FB451DRAFT_1168485 [Mycena latifolia]|nr:hypothetical protein FB451DRAFT_1168485 [Mycena latifolia]
MAAFVASLNGTAASVTVDRAHRASGEILQRCMWYGIPVRGSGRVYVTGTGYGVCSTAEMPLSGAQCCRGVRGENDKRCGDAGRGGYTWGIGACRLYGCPGSQRARCEIPLVLCAASATHESVEGETRALRPGGAPLRGCQGVGPTACTWLRWSTMSVGVGRRTGRRRRDQVRLWKSRAARGRRGCMSEQQARQNDGRPRGAGVARWIMVAR